MLFTSESVSCGHPDKICDQISDAILDEFLRQDPSAKVAVECFITNNMLVVGGEAHSDNASVDIIGIAKRVLENIGYDGTNGFNPETAVFINTLHEQSSNIRQGVDREYEEKQGAGDQGMMFGYACNQTKQYMPVEITLANEMMKAYDNLRLYGELPHARPDAKCQFTVEYGEHNYHDPIRTRTIVFSFQHDDDDSSLVFHANGFKSFYEETYNKVIAEVEKFNPELKYFLHPQEVFINPTGEFVIGGPEADTGLTGRKIIVDTYGGKCPHGGGAFSGKDPSKVDRSAAYYARYIAKNLVAAGVADELTVQLSYAIGIDKPISIFVDGYNLRLEKHEIISIIKYVFNPTPYNIIKTLNLKKPIYLPTATYGHFGQDFYLMGENEYYSWEKLDKVDEINNWIKDWKRL